MANLIPMSSGGQGSATNQIGGLAYDSRSLYSLRAWESNSLIPLEHEGDPAGTYHRTTYLLQTDFTGNNTIRTIYFEEWTHGRLGSPHVGGLLYWRNHLIGWINLRNYDNGVIMKTDGTIIKSLSVGTFTGLDYVSGKFFLCTGTTRTIEIYNKTLDILVTTIDLTSELPNASSQIIDISFIGKHPWVSFYDADRPAESRNGIAEIDLKTGTLFNKQYFTVTLYAILHNNRSGLFVSHSTSSLATLSLK